MTDDLTLVAAAFRGQGRPHSRLYWWMMTHYEALARAKAEGSYTDWIGVAARMRALGFKTAGKPPKPETIRRTWYRVAADWKAGKNRVHLVAGPIQAGLAESGTWPPPAAPADDDDFLAFRTLKPKEKP